MNGRARGGRGDELLLYGLVGVLLALLLTGCGRGGAVSGPDPVTDAAAVVLPARQAALPARLYGAFTSSADVPEMAAQAGNVVLVVPTYADDPETVAAAIQANGKVAIVSMHHVFGGPRATWDAGWARTREWMAPLESRGLVAAIYVIDEPLHAGIPAARRDEAIGIVRSAGYRTMLAEGVDRAIVSARPPVDLYGVTCYTWPGVGSWSQERCLTAYRDRPSWDLVIGQGYDLQQTRGYNGPVAQQVARWAELGRARGGVVFWVARWPGQTGILDDPEMRAAFNAAGRQ